MDKDKMKQDLEEIEPINIELDHRVTKLIAENEHLKLNYKQHYDSIKPSHIQSKEQCAKLISQTLKDELRKLKGKAIVDNNVSNHPSDPELHQVNVEPITPKLLNKRTAHSAYTKHSQEEVSVLRDLVDHIKANYPLDPLLESACRSSRIRRILKDGGEDFCYSDTEHFSRSDEVLKVKNFKKDATLKLSKSTNQEWYEHVGPDVTRSQDVKVTRWRNEIMFG
ncbi:hypothetical protein Tco_0432168 [Tanacetum coccineum]